MRTLMAHAGAISAAAISDRVEKYVGRSVACAMGDDPDPFAIHVGNHIRDMLGRQIQRPAPCGLIWPR